MPNLPKPFFTTPADEFAAYCLELLSPLGAVRAKKMFGGRGIYVDDLFIALIALEQLYLKVDDATRGHFEAAGCRPFVFETKDKPIQMNYYNPPTEALESPAVMLPWARWALEAALRARANKSPRRSTNQQQPASVRRRSKATPKTPRSA
jgi:DNA transformation protein and related proteins